MDSIRVNTGLKKITVNEKGDYISFSISDASFFEKFFELIEWFESEKTTAEINEIGEKANEAEGMEDRKAVKSVIASYKNLISQCLERIDNIFGENASEKIFDGILPDMNMVSDFFEQITPLINKYIGEREKKINSKYSKNRKGTKK